jgi:hypothetical protein
MSSLAWVCVHIKSRHQNVRYSSPKQPFSSTKVLYAAMAALFSACHASAAFLANSAFKAFSSVAERLMLRARDFQSKSLLILRFVAFFGAFVSNKACMVVTQQVNAHCCVQRNQFAKVGQCAAVSLRGCRWGRSSLGRFCTGQLLSGK